MTSVRQLAGIFATASLALGGSRAAAAAEFQLALRSIATGRVIAERRVQLGGGEEARLAESGVRLAPGAAPVDLILAVSVERETADGAVVALHGIVRAEGESTPLSWTSRTYSLRRGEGAAFTVAPSRSGGGIEFSARIREPSPGGPELAPITLTTRLGLSAASDGAAPPIEERRVRLVGPDPTVVVFEGSGSSPETLVLRLTPRARSRKGAVLDLVVEGRRQTLDGSRRDVTVDLGWDDTVEVGGLEGPAGPLRVEIRLER